MTATFDGEGIRSARPGSAAGLGGAVVGAPPVRPSLPAEEDIADLADVFGMLGEPTRVRLLIALLPGPMRVRDMATAIGSSESAVSHALRLLRAHRIVSVRRSGRVAFYDLADAHVRTLLELALAHVGHTMLLHPAPTDGHPPASDCSATSRATP